MFLRSLIEDQARRKIGNSYRKRLGNYSYKLKRQGYSSPGLMPPKQKDMLQKVGTEKARQIIKKIQNNSSNPYLGHHRKGYFVFNEKMFKEYIVPDLTDFNLKPYMSVHTPQVDPEELNKLRMLNDFTNPENLKPRAQ